LADDEATRLPAAAPDRKPLYLTALLTGLRRSEVKALVWGDMHLDAPRPFLTLRASTAKNRKAATIWLRDDLVAELRRIRPSNAGDGVSVFGRLPKMERFRAEAAGRLPRLGDVAFAQKPAVG
jgi:integrase